MTTLSTHERALERVNASIPPRAAPPSHTRRMLYRGLGSALAPLNWAAAHAYGTPGLDFHRRCAELGLRTLFNRETPLEARWQLHMLFSPVVLTRYFEFDFAWRHVPEAALRYLDVSSPFMFPILYLAHGRASRGDLINPDRNDIALIRQHVAACKLSARTSVHDCLIDEAPFADGTFDAITCLSVLEHIPSNRDAMAKMWALLRPGGRLILTLPCAARGYRLYTDIDHYGLLGSGQDGFTFLEYIYDDALLAETTYSVAGQPAAREVYGEKRAGILREELLKRWSGAYWQFWSEPAWMGQNFQRFDRIADLPGEGVIGLAFVKP